MTECRIKECPFDAVEWGRLIEKVDTMNDRQIAMDKKIDMALGNGLTKRVRRVEYTLWSFLGGLSVVVFLIKEWAGIRAFLGL
jgi:hypothetical protein